ncbi:T/G mismatch-specific endonuclease [Krasilnikovia cinnamomea]|uniref:Very short patch repair endonuclease n=2 Tax=Krasilnikovia cinnamomea TaxID=349313 RepID=A0A4Q7ZJX8_9ACTN|nr:T/G mismatch-specific endonuclease [Krasilnikovia cinnamomea]
MSRTPAALNEAVSAQMQRMPRERTKPEMLLRRELHRRGMRFRVNYGRLPGRPDIVFTRVKLGIFVDGCFWHVCPSHSTMPKNNAEWWRAKLSRNVERDREKDELLISCGWRVLHVWEHEDTHAAADRIEALYLSLRHAFFAPPEGLS